MSVNSFLMKYRNRLILAGSAAACVAVVAWYMQRPDANQVAGEPVRMLNDIILAQPINLTHFVWKTTKKEFLFYRPQVNQPWSPPVHADLLREREKLFEGLTLFGRVQAKSPKVIIRGQFQAGIVGSAPEPDQWVELGWDGDFLFFTAGPNAGKGRRLTVEETWLFLEGDHAFDKREIDWCPGRLVVIKYGGKVLAENHDHSWKTRQVAVHEPLSQNEIEAWMGQHCRVEAERIMGEDTVLPLSLQPTVFQPIEYEFLFKNGVRKEIVQVAPEVVKIDGVHVRSRKFLSALKKLAGAL